MAASRRLFVGLSIPEEVQRRIYGCLNGWEGLNAPFAEFQHGIMMHATMIPPFDADSVEEVVCRLAELEQCTSPVRATLRGFSIREPYNGRHGTLRVMIQQSAELDSLCANVKKCLGAAPSPFSGHVTLARLGEADPQSVPEGFAVDFVEEFGEVDLSDITWLVTHVAVFESDSTRPHLQPPQPKYSIEREVPMGQL